MAAPTETHGDLRQEHLERGKIAIVGSGLIGRGWSMLFAAVGHPVCVYDVEQKQVLAAFEFIEAELKRHEKEGTLRGTLNAAQQRALISSSSDLKSCDGVLSVADIDKVMWAGLGPRYAFLGPLETAHLNADGIVDCMRQYGAGLEHVSATMGPTPVYTAPPPSLEQINKQLEEMTPLGEMGARRAWRDKMLSALARLKRDMETE
ncbi:PREDICTED: lambda-crystallin homolog [Priapulus caudatus]|uniref:Lambda-crystallin homolog n=1 Tax=Priapulus caudatus TaxID=37621 RepID=A0ABM1EXL6_PRICU|nr:PREDICTED: lambda-crystallin homolog [Priapulus caudatus]